MEVDHARRLVGSLLWLALSGLFALYATFSGSYSRTYGTLAAGVILLLWLNYPRGRSSTAPSSTPRSDEAPG